MNVTPQTFSPRQIPTFPREVYEATVPENVADYLVTTVRAEDPDSAASRSVTYRLASGDPGSFAVHPRTGVVRTLRGLDFERRRTHELVVGTEEAFAAGAAGAGAGSTCRVVVSVEDRNDSPPLFTRLPRGNIIEVHGDCCFACKPNQYWYTH